MPPYRRPLLPWCPTTQLAGAPATKRYRDKVCPSWVKLHNIEGQRLSNLQTFRISTINIINLTVKTQSFAKMTARLSRSTFKGAIIFV